MTDHRSHTDHQGDCPDCQRERAQAIATRNQIRQFYRVDHTAEFLEAAAVASPQLVECDDYMNQVRR